jgi:bifunctional DNase/RNase
MSHDLLGHVVSALGAKLFAVEITELAGNTFFASLRLVRSGEEINVSARPSDAVALALRMGAPILVSDDLMAAEGKVMQLAYDEDDEEYVELDTPDEADLVAQLRAFLDQVRPEDFGT